MVVVKGGSSTEVREPQFMTDGSILRIVNIR